MLKPPKPWHFMPHSLYLWKKKKNHVNKKSRMGWFPSKYEPNENRSRHNPKKKQKQTKIK
jgi:hypothetical protein